MARPTDGPSAKTRGPWLGNATGWKADEGSGTSERPVGKTAAGPLRNVGDSISCAGTGVVDVTLGTSFVYSFGKVDQRSIGRYRLSSQAETAGADALSTKIYVDFDLIEETAGVFNVTEAYSIDADIATGTTMVALEDAALDGATPDNETTVFVVNAADVTDAAAWTAPVVLKLGELVLVHGIATRDRFILTRLTAE